HQQLPILPSPASVKNLFQNQWRRHTVSTISSMGTPFVSGSSQKTKAAMITIQIAKKKKMKAFILHIMERKACAMRKVKSMLELTAKENPVVLVARGNVSDGISHPRGPHDHAKLET
ncbi:Os07g0206650, partial [Oryza sativa Japonica Group]